MPIRWKIISDRQVCRAEKEQNSLSEIVNCLTLCFGMYSVHRVSYTLHQRSILVENHVEFRLALVNV